MNSPDANKSGVQKFEKGGLFTIIQLIAYALVFTLKWNKIHFYA